MRIRILLTVLFFAAIASAQTRTAIDSLNAVPYRLKVAKPRSYERLYLQNAEAARKLRYRQGEAESYANVALACYFQGKYDADLAYSLKAIRIYQQLNDLERLAFHYAETGYRMKRRDMERAQHYMQRGLRLAESNRFTRPLLAIYNNYGVLKEMQGQLDSALFFYRKSLEVQQKANDSAGIPYSLNNIAGIHLMRREYGKAEPLFEKVLTIRRQLADTIGMAETYTSLGDLAASQSQRRKAIGFYGKALEIASGAGYLNLMSSSHRMLSDQYEALGDPVRALFHFRKHAQVKDSILNTETASRIAELEVEFETGEKEKQLALQKADLLEKDLQVRQSRSVVVGVSVVALFLGLLGYLLWRQQRMANRQQRQEFELKSAIATIESQNRLQEQRLAISRDLHDNIGAQLTFIVSSVETLQYAYEVSNGKLAERLGRITDFTRSTITELRDTIWAMNQQDMRFEDLEARILNFVENARMAAEGVHFHFRIGPGLGQKMLSSVVGMNLYRVIQEAVHNALKYAAATDIFIDAALSGDVVLLSVRDNGHGFDRNHIAAGNGLFNMEKRIESIGGVCSITSSKGDGTLVAIRIAQNQLQDQTLTP